ncbi:MAG: hypothetical protein J4G16_15790 [Acidobacteria bacterium]|nr:hypothetical protein [Acidobacteriota bacterium]
MALAYSARFSRWTAGLPGSGFSRPARSSSVSSHSMNPWVAAAVGRGRPAGGIAFARSRRITCSQVSAFVSTCATSSVSRAKPAVSVRRLWQATQ